MLIVIGLHFLIADLHVALDLRGIHQNILNLAFLRNRVGVRGLVLIVIGLQFGVGRMNALENVILVQNCVVELNLGVFFLELLPHLSIADNRATGNQDRKSVV